MEFCNSPSLSDIRTVKEASAVCRSFLDGVVIFVFRMALITPVLGNWVGGI